MNISKKSINAFRRSVMHRVTNNIGKSQSGVSMEPIINSEIQRILICRPNKRLGNLLLLTPLLQEVLVTFPNSKIDLFVTGNLAPAIFKNYENVDRIIQLPTKIFKQLIKYAQGWLSIKKNRYDLVINVVENSSSGRLSTQFASSKYKFFGNSEEGIQLRYQDYGHAAKFPVYAFRTYLIKRGFAEKNKPIPALDLKLSAYELTEGEKRLKNLVDNEKKTIGLFTNATGDKCYSECWWGIFYERLKTEYPDYNIVEVLPVDHISNLSFKAPTFSDKDVRAVGAFIANTALFICADGGVMHLSSAVHTPTIGLFSVTNPNHFQPYDNDSVGFDTNNSSIDECMKAIDKILADRLSH